MIRKIYIIPILLFLIASAGSAQKTCKITGEISNTQLRQTNDDIKTIFLNKYDDLEQLHVVDSAKVRNGHFSIQYPIPADSYTQVYLLTGFDNGSIPLWIEPGNIKVSIADAAFPSNAIVSGTPTNDLTLEFNQFSNEAKQIQHNFIIEMRKKKGDDWINSKEGIAARITFGAKAITDLTTKRLDFMLDHLDSPLVPLFANKIMIQALGERALSRLVKSISPALHQHPYYTNFRDAVIAKSLKPGVELPNFEMTTIDGKTISLKDLRGKYVLIDFWASWCGPCRREMPHIKQLAKVAEADFKDKFIIIGFSVDDSETKWKAAVDQLDIQRPNWIQTSDLKAWASPIARLFGVSAIPQLVFINPQGRMISNTLRGEETEKFIMAALKSGQYE